MESSSPSSLSRERFGGVGGAAGLGGGAVGCSLPAGLAVGFAAALGLGFGGALALGAGFAFGLGGAFALGLGSALAFGDLGVARSTAAEADEWSAVCCGGSDAAGGEGTALVACALPLGLGLGFAGALGAGFGFGAAFGLAAFLGGSSVAEPSALVGRFF